MDRNRLTRIVWGVAVVVAAAAVFVATGGPRAGRLADDAVVAGAADAGKDGSSCGWHESALAATDADDACAGHAMASGSACAHDGAMAGDCDACPFMKEDAAATGVLAGTFDPSRTEMCEGACSAPVDADAVTLVAQPGVAAGDYTRCPVSGVVFAVQPDQAHVAYEGAEYYTCCDGCARMLSRDPARYIAS